MAITNRLKRLRKKAADEGLVINTAAGASSKEPKGNGSGKNSKAKGGKKIALEGSE